MADNPTRVVLETTKGDIALDVHSDWSPIGATHFLELVKLGFYNGAPWFRVLDGFVAQCGIAADPALNEEWGEKTIKDDPVVAGNLRGNLAFGKTGAPHSRSTHIFINYRDNSHGLDPQGFSAFAQVVDGMDIADSLARCEYSDQYRLKGAGGLEDFKRRFPDADYILRAYVSGE
jgi:cyclophilin family peptidyl-prolyl cis-trans isomerase